MRAAYVTNPARPGVAACLYNTPNELHAVSISLRALNSSYYIPSFSVRSVYEARFVGDDVLCVIDLLTGNGTAYMYIHNIFESEQANSKQIYPI